MVERPDEAGGWQVAGEVPDHTLAWIDDSAQPGRHDYRIIAWGELGPSPPAEVAGCLVRRAPKAGAAKGATAGTVAAAATGTSQPGPKPSWWQSLWRGLVRTLYTLLVLGLSLALRSQAALARLQALASGALQLVGLRPAGPTEGPTTGVAAEAPASAALAASAAALGPGSPVARGSPEAYLSPPEEFQGFPTVRSSKVLVVNGGREPAQRDPAISQTFAAVPAAAAAHKSWSASELPPAPVSSSLTAGGGRGMVRPPSWQGNVSPPGLSGSPGDGPVPRPVLGNLAPVEDDDMLEGTSPDGDSPVLQCSHPSCRVRWDRWPPELKRRHFCGLCERWACQDHTASSNHGPLSRCDLDSKCVCQQCFSTLPNDHPVRKRLLRKGNLSNSKSSLANSSSSNLGSIDDLHGHEVQARALQHWGRARLKIKSVQGFLQGRKAKAAASKAQGTV